MGIGSCHQLLGFPLKSSRYYSRNPAGPLPVFEGVASDDPATSQADGRDDSLLQHCVDREAADVQAARDFVHRHPRREHGRPAGLRSRHILRHKGLDRAGVRLKIRAVSHGRVLSNTHNEARFAVDALSGESAYVIYIPERGKKCLTKNSTRVSYSAKSA